jgi:hypothetical protein
MTGKYNCVTYLSFINITYRSNTPETTTYLLQTSVLLMKVTQVHVTVYILLYSRQGKLSSVWSPKSTCYILRLGSYANLVVAQSFEEDNTSTSYVRSP